MSIFGIRHTLIYWNSKNMQNIIIWLFGDELGKSIITSLNWLIEAPPARSSKVEKTSNEITIEHASQLLELMRSKVLNLQHVVEQVRQSTHRNQYQYNLKDQRRQDLSALSLEYKHMGQIVEARLAMAKAIEIERILPEFQAKLVNSEEMLMRVNEIHAQKESELSLLEIDVENMKAYIAMNGHHDDKSQDLIALQEKLRNSSIEAEDRCLEIQIESQLTNPSNCELGETLNTQDIDARIAELENNADRSPDRSHNN
jgi:phage shock protein A